MVTIRVPLKKIDIFLSDYERKTYIKLFGEQ